jgi:hypothetical protein
VLLLGLLGAGGGWLLAYTATICSVYADAPPELSHCDVRLFELTLPRAVGTIVLTVLGLVVGLAVGWTLARRVPSRRP